MQHSKTKSLDQQYNVLTAIGQGSFGQVKLVQHKITKKRYAMKTISNINPILIEDIKKEVDIMRRIKSRYALHIIDDFYDDYQNEYYILSQYHRKGDLRGAIKKKQFVLSDHEILNLIFQMRQAFIQLNQQHIIHRDLKPQNILISDEGEYRVCDFGCSKFLEAQASKFLKFSSPFGTLLYNSPEIYLANDSVGTYNKSVDVWSLGIIVYEIIYGTYPVKIKDGNYVYNDVEAVFKGKKPINFPEQANVNPKTIQLLKKMLTIDKEKRIKWQKLIQQVDYVITNISQLLDHVIHQTKIICYVIDLLNKPENNLFLNSILDKKKITTLFNCLIMLQYDQLEQIQTMLNAKKSRKDCLILPHVYLEFDKNNASDFYDRKQKNKQFRTIVAQKFPLERVQAQVEKISTQICNSLKNINNKNYEMGKIYEILLKLQKYRIVFTIKNNYELKKYYENLMKQ